MVCTPTIPISTPTIPMPTTIKVPKLPNLSILHAASTGLEQFTENPELPADQGLFLTFVGLELTQNGLNVSA